MDCASHGEVPVHGLMWTEAAVGQARLEASCPLYPLKSVLGSQDILPLPAGEVSMWSIDPSENGKSGGRFRSGAIRLNLCTPETVIIIGSPPT